MANSRSFSFSHKFDISYIKSQYGLPIASCLTVESDTSSENSEGGD